MFTRMSDEKEAFKTMINRIGVSLSSTFHGERVERKQKFASTKCYRVIWASIYISCYIFSVIHIRTVVNECGGHKKRIITQLLFALFDAYKCKWETIATNVLVRVNVLKNLWNVYNVLINVDFVLLCPWCFFFFFKFKFEMVDLKSIY